MPNLLVIDGNSLMHRAFHALPLLTNEQGEYTNAVYGFLGMLLRLLREEQPSHAAVAFDMHGPTFRHETFAEYKAGRNATPDEMRPQFPMLKEVLAAMGIAAIEKEGLEADDLLGCLAKQAEERGMPSLLVTGDKDALQLVRDGVTVLYTKRGISDTDRMDAQAVRDKMGVDPAHVPDLKGLMGDSSDNIPGVPGVGQKRAQALLAEYGDLEGVLAHAQEVSGPKLRQSLTDFADQARMSKEIATIVDDADCGLELDDYTFHMPGIDAVRPAFERYGFDSLLRRMGGKDNAPRSRQGEAPAPVQAKIVKQESAIQTTQHNDIESLHALLADGDVALYITPEALHVAKDATNDHVFDVTPTLLNEGVGYEQAMQAVGQLAADASRRMVVYDAKALAHELQAFGYALDAQADDVMLEAYCVDPSLGPQKPGELCEKLNLGSKEQGENAAALFALHAALQQRMDETDVEMVYRTIEQPLWRVLYAMECEGFRIDIPTIQAMGGDYSKQIEQTAQDIYELAGEQFNINSTRQLGVVLFENLKLPAGKKTKTGYSTSIDVLEGLRTAHPIIDKIIEYRRAAKLKSTYIDGLQNVADPKTGKVHTRFTQNITATGRISSLEPNLQNIPVRTEQGREIRRAFVPSGEGRLLAVADYSQIELRILAHMSGDENMIATFSRSGDIHTSTASEVFGTPLDSVTPAQRNAAKAVNFGIVYGIGDFTLSRNLGITRAEAADYIAKYLSRYPKVHAFMEACKENGKQDGYVTTLYGRRRYVPELQSRNFNQRSFGERVAMNAPIQGSAADVIKLAMIQVYEALQASGLDAKLILQVHDELIVDCAEQDIQAVEGILRDRMEHVAELNVPLKVDVGQGKTWLDAK